MIGRCCLLVVLIIVLTPSRSPPMPPGNDRSATLARSIPKSFGRRNRLLVAWIAPRPRSRRQETFSKSCRANSGREPDASTSAPESLRKAAARLESELESLQLDAAGGAARTEALEKTIQEVVVRGQEAAKRDEVAAEYATVVASREKALRTPSARRPGQHF